MRVTGEHPAQPPGGFGYYDDGLEDFLINRLPDAFYLPDTVLASDTHRSNFSVRSILNLCSREDPQNDPVDGSISVRIYHNVSSTELSSLPDWAYIRCRDPLARTDYVLESVTRPDVNYTLIPQRNSWQTSSTSYLIDGTIEEEDYIHLFDFGVAPVYALRYIRLEPVWGLRVVGRTNHSLSVSWSPATTGTASYVLVKPTAMSDAYYSPAAKFLQIPSCTIDGLSRGTEYKVLVFAGHDGIYERTGASVIGATLGLPSCGDSVLDEGEECDDGAGNGSPGSNCTLSCLRKKNPAAPTPTSPPPTPRRTPKPKPTPKPTPKATPKPTPRPTLRPPTCRKVSETCNSSSRLCCSGLLCTGGRCKRCIGSNKRCSRSGAPCCNGLKCKFKTGNASVGLCSPCRRKGKRCANAGQCCEGLQCSATQRVCV